MIQLASKYVKFTGKRNPIATCTLATLSCFPILDYFTALLASILPYYAILQYTPIDKTSFKWVSNLKLASFMDAYHAPYVPRNRYWTGLLPLSRVVPYLIDTINVSGEP